MNNILGISALYHDAAAAAVRGGEIVAAVQEERFSRRKNDARFPQAAINYCLAELGGPDRVHATAFYEDPVLSFDRVLRNIIDDGSQSARIWPLAAMSQLSEKFAVLERLQRAVGPRQTFIVDHHVSHIASAFYPSPFPAAAIVVADGVGEWASTTIAHGSGTEITPLCQIRYPHSLGLLYSAFTYHCGLKVNSGEYKLMGLAPYGNPRFVDLILDNLIDLRPDGSFHLNTAYFGRLDGERAVSLAFEALFGCPRRDPEAPINAIHMDLAASAQAAIDRAMLALARRALALTGERRLCLAGGVALNCVSNGRLLRELQGLDSIWIQPAAGDAGGALGAALHVAHRHFGAPRHAGVGKSDGQQGSLLGPTFQDTEIEQALREAGLSWHRAPDEKAHDQRVVEALAAGQIVGRFAGRMEFGPRALGNRSILADPRRPDGQSHINRRIKFRESWRPFAPVVLAEHAGSYFELEQDSPYMLLVGNVREHLRRPVDFSGFIAGDHDMTKLLNQPRSEIPAVTHIDYSARVQTVDADRNPAFHRLLRQFFAHTGCPVLVNTSFNVRGEPIVCSPADAVRCFLNTGIDLLAIGPFLVLKTEQPAALRAREGTITHEPD
ncbi:carbamoyltransferase [Sinorhizobium meliloti]|uniref:carbamoyltransferase family protein n=1 Tax=Rhizobium meliloti TaxID=382 RepID=UPI00192D34F7|nr:carbamoyltransferase C-terminal domain-containing protein [Sinorhizobium meliloti]